MKQIADGLHETANLRESYGEIITVQLATGVYCLWCISIQYYNLITQLPLKNTFTATHDLTSKVPTPREHNMQIFCVTFQLITDIPKIIHE